MPNACQCKSIKANLFWVFVLFCFADEPGAPGQPEATDWDKDHVDLKWTPPISDGGAPITAYIIEKREPETGKWIKAAEVPATTCTATVPQLAENTEYEFRVRAVNAAGPGTPSKASKPVITKPRKRKHIIVFHWTLV